MCYGCFEELGLGSGADRGLHSTAQGTDDGPGATCRHGREVGSADGLKDMRHCIPSSCEVSSDEGGNDPAVSYPGVRRVILNLVCCTMVCSL